METTIKELERFIQREKQWEQVAKEDLQKASEAFLEAQFRCNEIKNKILNLEKELVIIKAI
jgi:hypothetical protein